MKNTRQTDRSVWTISKAWWKKLKVDEKKRISIEINGHGNFETMTDSMVVTAYLKKLKDECEKA